MRVFLQGKSNTHIADPSLPEREEAWYRVASEDASLHRPQGAESSSDKHDGDGQLNTIASQVMRFMSRLTLMSTASQATSMNPERRPDLAPAVRDLNGEPSWKDDRGYPKSRPPPPAPPLLPSVPP